MPFAAHTNQAVHTVAVVGAGISGVCAAAHLLRQGLNVVLFERSGTAGGVWHYDERSAPDPQYPNNKPSVGDYLPYARPKGCYSTPPATPPQRRSYQQQLLDIEQLRGSDEFLDDAVKHAPPGPCYIGLKNNVSLPSMKTTLAEWPVGLEDFVSQRYLEEYIQHIAETAGVNSIALYHTRVEEIRKADSGSGWRVRTTTLQQQRQRCGADRSLIEESRDFDAVVVASGHYNMPRIPDIPGLKEWKRKFPERVMHSKGYRSAQVFKDRRILLVGAGVSSTDIAKESSGVAENIFQSSRGGILDLPASMLPEGAERVQGVRAFHLDSGAPQSALGAREPVPGFVELSNRRVLREIHNVVLATGYVTSYPFLPQYQSDVLGAEDADGEILVTAEGDMVHNLHQDIFYIPDPTLAFVGVPYHIATFSLFEFQAQVVARVFAGAAELLNTLEMREQYQGRVQSRGLGRDFHSLRPDGEELAYVEQLVHWMNTDARRLGFAEMEGHTAAFYEAYKLQRQRLKALGRVLERSNDKKMLMKDEVGVQRAT